MRGAASLAAFIWAGTIFWLSSQSGPEIEQFNVLDLWDKAAHFLAFCGGAPPLFCAIIWSLRDESPAKAVILTFAVLALYGAADEVHQLYTPKRSGADVYDWTADALGSLIGTLGTAYFYARTQRPKAGKGLAGSPREAGAAATRN
jgi:VanZ family protein